MINNYLNTKLNFFVRYLLKYINIEIIILLKSLL